MEVNSMQAAIFICLHKTVQELRQRKGKQNKLAPAVSLEKVREVGGDSDDYAPQRTSWHVFD